MKKNNIVFNRINLRLIFFYKIFQKLGFNIYYLYQNKKINKKEISLLKKNNLQQIDLSRLTSISTQDWKKYWINEIDFINNICAISFSSDLKKLLKSKLMIKDEKAVNFFLFEDTFAPVLFKAELLEIFSKKKGFSFFISFEIADYFIQNNNLFKKIIIPINIFPSFANIKKIFKVIYNYVILFLQKSKENQFFISKKKIEIKKPQLIYMLHKGSKVVNNYKNIIIDFENNKNSLLNEKKVLIFDYTNTKINSSNFNIIQYSEIKYSPKVLFDTLKVLLLLIKTIRSVSDFFLIIKIAKSIFGYFKFNNFLKLYPTLKVAFIDYDFLCPKFLIFCLMSNNIKTLSYQERPITVFYNNISFFYDYYFTTSNFFSEKISKKTNFIVDKKIDCGFYDLEKYNSSNYDLQKTNRQTKTKILFLNFQSSDNQFSKLNDLAVSDRSHKKFLYDFIKIAKTFPSAEFSISSKGMSYFKNEEFKFFFNKIYKIKNIKIVPLSDDVKTLDLIEKNDLVIGKPSSIMEKCLYLGRPILIHEYTNNITHQMSQVMDIYDDFFYCNSPNDLINKISTFLNNNMYFIDNVIKQKNKLFKYIFKTRNIIQKNIENLLK